MLGARRSSFPHLAFTIGIHPVLEKDSHMNDWYLNDKRYSADEMQGMLEDEKLTQTDLVRRGCDEVSLLLKDLVAKCEMAPFSPTFMAYYPPLKRQQPSSPSTDQRIVKKAARKVHSVESIKAGVQQHHKEFVEMKLRLEKEAQEKAAQENAAQKKATISAAPAMAEDAQAEPAKKKNRGGRKCGAQKLRQNLAHAEEKKRALESSKPDV